MNTRQTSGGRTARNPQRQTMSDTTIFINNLT
jgi:hypothetical protein